MQYTKRLALVSLTGIFVLLLLYHASNSLPPVPQRRSHGFQAVSSTFSNSEVDWSRFAYVQYATNLPYLCNSLMLFERLHTFRSKADRLLLYPTQMSPDSESPEADLLRKARDTYHVTLQPIEIQLRNPAGSDTTWSASYTKLLAYNQTSYARLLHLDSDSTLLQPLDELFLLPPCAAAMPRSYWEAQPKLSSQLLLLEPSAHEFARVEKAIAEAGPTDYDMEILNTLYRDAALVLPHKIYDLYTREFTLQRDTGANHERYLGDESARWDPDVAAETAKFIHFSDWPLPKPWLKADSALVDKIKPPCVNDDATDQEMHCREQQIWLGFYEDFRRRRKEVCGLDPV